MVSRSVGTFIGLRRTRSKPGVHSASKRRIVRSREQAISKSLAPRIRRNAREIDPHRSVRQNYNGGSVCPNANVGPLPRSIAWLSNWRSSGFYSTWHRPLKTRSSVLMDARLICPTPGCGTVIRKHIGLHGPGEPMVWTDARGEHVRCPRCHVRIPWPPAPDPIPDLPTAA